MAAISALITWLGTFGRNFLTWGYNTLVDLLNGGISGFATFCTSAVSLFPSGAALPTFSVPSGSVFDACLTVVNWVFPVGFCASCLIFLVGAYLSYWIIAPLARWLKLLT